MHDLEILVLVGLVSEENTIAVLEKSRYPRANPGVKLNDALEERATRILDAFAHILASCAAIEGGYRGRLANVARRSHRHDSIE